MYMSNGEVGPDKGGRGPPKLGLRGSQCKSAGTVPEGPTKISREPDVAWGPWLADTCSG